MLRAGRYRYRRFISVGRFMSGGRFISVGLGALAVLLLGAPTTAPADPPSFDFAKGVVAGADVDRATTLRFGPDGRLYVGQQNGLIKILTLVRHGPGSFEAVASETLGALVDLPNHDDDGRENPRYVGRLLTGLVVSGTAARPVIHAVTTDPRIGGGQKKVDRNLDTNSGILSRLTWDGGQWQRLDLVRGLPRSEENHAGNGLVFDSAGNLLLAQGGNTNNGAPSEQFVLTPEFALSAAILSIDLAAIGETTYDLPTLDDPARAGSEDAGDPFGGADGSNQARLVPGGPVQVYAPGFRNAYDLVRTADGRLFTVDNGPNPGFGDVPEARAGKCTNEVRPGGKREVDSLHQVKRGTYGGHPNPTRANPENTFAGQSPVTEADPKQCEFRTGAAAGALATFTASTNGITEYTSRAAFDGALAGNLLVASFDNTIYRLEVRPDGTLGDAEALFEGVASVPLDVTAQGDGDVFPGTIWVGDVTDGSITVFEPPGTA